MESRLPVAVAALEAGVDKVLAAAASVAKTEEVGPGGTAAVIKARAGFAGVAPEIIKDGDGRVAIVVVSRGQAVTVVASQQAGAVPVSTAGVAIRDGVRPVETKD